MVVKLQAVTFGTTFEIVWGNMASLLHVLIQMYGLGFQNKRQERRNTKLYFNDVVVISETENADARYRLSTREDASLLLDIGFTTKPYHTCGCQYVQSAVHNVEDHLAKAGEKLPYKAPTPLSSGYHTEIDVSPELGETDASHFHSLVGVLWWIVELRRVDINVEVSMMSSQLALLWMGHLKEICHSVIGHGIGGIISQLKWRNSLKARRWSKQ